MCSANNGSRSRIGIVVMVSNNLAFSFKAGLGSFSRDLAMIYPLEIHPPCNWLPPIFFMGASAPRGGMLPKQSKERFETGELVFLGLNEWTARMANGA
jgi:hypothetical protein